MVSRCFKDKASRNKPTALSVFATLAMAAVASPSSSAMGAFLMSTLNCD